MFEQLCVTTVLWPHGKASEFFLDLPPEPQLAGIVYYQSLENLFSPSERLLWNSLPIGLKQQNNINIFTRELKQWLKSGQSCFHVCLVLFNNVFLFVVKSPMDRCWTL